MPISSKTRKILWARSGNRCAYCFKQLVTAQNGVQINCGEECHIVSKRLNGPRHRNMECYDDYDNLILLCQEHHKMVDDFPDKYPEDKLKLLKTQHENKVNELKIDEQKNLLLLHRATTVRDVVRCLQGAEQYATDYPAEQECDYDLFAEFFEWVNNFDVIEDYDEFTKINYMQESFEKIVNKGYIILCGQQNSGGKLNLKTSFVIILTQEQFKNLKICK